MQRSESIVLDVTDFDDWPQLYDKGCTRIAIDSRPTVVQPDRDSAEREAVRLAQSTGRRFAVFILAGIVETKDVPTHVTLGGTVVATTKKPVWQDRDL